MTYYPHRRVKHRWAKITSALIAGLIALAMSSCSKQPPLQKEPRHGEINMKDTVYKWQGWGNRDSN